MTRRTNAQIKADLEEVQRGRDAGILMEAAKIMNAYGVPASANVLQVVANSILEGKRERSVKEVNCQTGEGVNMSGLPEK